MPRPSPASTVAGASPGRTVITPPSARSTTAGNSPNPTHSAARTACGTSIAVGDSSAAAAAVLRGKARKLIPNALTKHAAASAVVNASSAPQSGKISRTNAGVDAKPRSSAWNISHSLVNPFKSGSPEIAIAPTRKNRPVHGIRRSSPPNSSSCRVPAAITTLPAPRNSSPLNTA